MYSFTRTATLTANIGGTKGEVGGMKSPYSMARNQELNKIQSVQHNQVLKLQGRGQGNACSGQGSSGKEYPSPVRLFRRALLVKAGGNRQGGPRGFPPGKRPIYSWRFKFRMFSRKPGIFSIKRRDCFVVSFLCLSSVLDTDSYWGLSQRHTWQKQKPMMAAPSSTLMSRKTTWEFSEKTDMYKFMFQDTVSCKFFTVDKLTFFSSFRVNKAGILNHKFRGDLLLTFFIDKYVT